MGNSNLNQPILILTKTISRRTGGSSSILDVCETLYSLGYNVHIGMTVSNKLLYILKDKKNAKCSIPLKNIHTVNKSLGRYFNKKNVSFQGDTELADRLKSLVHQISRILSGLVFRSRFYYILRNCDIIFSGVPFYRGALEAVRKSTKGRIILNHPGSVHTFEEYWLSDNNRPLNYDNNQSLYVNYCKQFDKILFQAEDQANECANKAPCLESLPIVIKPTCDEKIVLRALNSKSPYDQEDFNIVNIGSVQPRKAQEFSVHAFDLFLKKNPASNVKLNFVGTILDNEYYKEINKTIQTLGLEEKVFFYKHRTDYLRFIAHADVLLQSSKAEGVSRMLREAMLLNVPIVSFKISGTKDILSHENNEAFLAEPFDTEELALGIENLYLDMQYKSTLKSNAFEKYLKNYSWVKYASTLIEVIYTLRKQ